MIVKVLKMGNDNYHVAVSLSTTRNFKTFDDALNFIKKMSWLEEGGEEV